MTPARIIIEMGSGNDLHDEDYTKAARRAVQDALHHSSLILFRSLGLDREAMQIHVLIGVQKPERIDHAAVASELPYGKVSVKAVLGGLDVADPVAGTLSVVATAAVTVRYAFNELVFEGAFERRVQSPRDASQCSASDPVATSGPGDQRGSHRRERLGKIVM